jgi:RNA-directed DNA polymerase
MSPGFSAKPLSIEHANSSLRTGAFTFFSMEEKYLQWRAVLKPEQKKRSYKHFDKSFDLDDPADFRFVISILESIKTHQFLPFVKFIKKEIRYQRNSEKVVTRKRKERPIMYASHLDSHIYSFYANQWGRKYEDYLIKEKISDNAIAYRKILKGTGNLKGKNNIAFSKEVFKYIQNEDECSVIIVDISHFFDSLNHKILKNHLTTILGNRLSDDEYKVLRSLTSFRYVLDDSRSKNKNGKYRKLLAKISKRIKQNNCSLAHAVYEVGGVGCIKENKTTIGIPQGSPLSGLLANIYMAFFDSEFVKRYPKILYRRYSDDIVIVCPISLTADIFSSLQSLISKYALEINPSKAYIATFRRQEDGAVSCVDVKTGAGVALGRKYIDYLGFEFDGSTVRVRGKTLKNAYRKAGNKIRKFYKRQTEKNPKEKPNLSETKRIKKSGSYIENAKRDMKVVGTGINSQQRNLFRFIRKKRNAEKKNK